MCIDDAESFTRFLLASHLGRAMDFRVTSGKDEEAIADTTNTTAEVGSLITAPIEMPRTEKLAAQDVYQVETSDFATGMVDSLIQAAMVISDETEEVAGYSFVEVSKSQSVSEIADAEEMRSELFISSPEIGGSSASNDNTVILVSAENEQVSEQVEASQLQHAPPLKSFSGQPEDMVAEGDELKDGAPKNEHPGENQVKREEQEGATTAELLEGIQETQDSENVNGEGKMTAEENLVVETHQVENAFEVAENAEIVGSKEAQEGQEPIPVPDTQAPVETTEFEPIDAIEMEQLQIETTKEIEGEEDLVADRPKVEILPAEIETEHAVDDDVTVNVDENENQELICEGVIEIAIGLPEATASTIFQADATQSVVEDEAKVSGELEVLQEDIKEQSQSVEVSATEQHQANGVLNKVEETVDVAEPVVSTTEDADAARSTQTEFSSVELEEAKDQLTDDEITKVSESMAKGSVAPESMNGPDAEHVVSDSIVLPEVTQSSSEAPPKDAKVSIHASQSVSDIQTLYEVDMLSSESESEDESNGSTQCQARSPKQMPRPQYSHTLANEILRLNLDPDFMKLVDKRISENVKTKCEKTENCWVSRSSGDRIFQIIRCQGNPIDALLNSLKLFGPSRVFIIASDLKFSDTHFIPADVEYLASELRRNHFPTVAIHQGQSSADRNAALHNVRTKRRWILVTTQEGGRRIELAKMDYEHVVFWGWPQPVTQPSACDEILTTVKRFFDGLPTNLKSFSVVYDYSKNVVDLAMVPICVCEALRLLEVVEMTNPKK